MRHGHEVEQGTTIVHEDSPWISFRCLKCGLWAEVPIDIDESAWKENCSDRHPENQLRGTQ